MKRLLQFSLLLVALCMPGARAAPTSCAEILLIPEYTSYVTQITDAMLERSGCRFATDDPQIADALFRLALAARRGAREAQGRPDRFEHRNKLVYLSGDGVRTTVAYNQAYINASQIEATWNGAPVWLDAGLHKQVRDIVRRMAAGQTNTARPESCSRI